MAIIVTVAYAESTSVLHVYTLADEDDLNNIQYSYLDAAKIFPVTFDDDFFLYSVSHSGNELCK